MSETKALERLKDIMLEHAEWHRKNAYTDNYNELHHTSSFILEELASIISKVVN